MTAIDNQGKEKLAAARVWAAHRFPYLASALLACEVVAMVDIPTMAVDSSWRLYINPNIIQDWTVPQLGSTFIHHVGHLLRDHSERAISMGVTYSQANTWIKCADAEINDDLLDVHLENPIKPILPQDLGCEPGRLAEEYFLAIRHEQSSTDPNSNNLEQSSTDPNSNNLEQSSTDPNNCGSGADGQQRIWDLSTSSVRGLSKHEASMIRTQVAIEILNSDTRGDIPAGLRRWAEAMLESKVNWKSILASTIRQSLYSTWGNSDFSYSRPSRRSRNNVILPSMRKTIPNIVIICDTSASVSEKLLMQSLGEVEAILRSSGVSNQNIRIITCDSAVHTIKKISSSHYIELFGGGGTDMRLGIETSLTLHPKPTLLIVLTDGDTPWPEQKPAKIEVVIGLLGSNDNPIPSWAKQVRIEEVA